MNTRLGTLLFMVAAVLGCVEDEGFRPQSGKITVQVSVSDSGLTMRRLASGREQHVSASFGIRWLYYELRDQDGRNLRSGRVPDPRLRRTEWNDGRSTHSALNDVGFGTFVLALPAIDAELIVFEEDTAGRTEIGRTAVNGGSEASRHELGLASNREIGPLWPMLEHGPRNTSVDLLFLPEGYQAGEEELFYEAVEKVISTIQSRADWGQHFDRFNFWSQWVPSRDGAIDAGPDPDTAFEFAIVGDTAKTESYEAVTLIDRLATEAEAQVAIMIVKSNVAFRSTAGDIVVLSAADDRAGVIAHELGHKLTGLSDEYEEQGRPCGGGRSTPGPNVSLFADRSSVPWRDLVNSSTPLPTPARRNEIGAYRGAWYCTSAYRPEHDCMMRNCDDTPACAVCQREIDRYMEAFTTIPFNVGSTDDDTGAWWCEPDWRGGDGACDCGCGEIDPDCREGGCAEAGCDQAACDYCFGPDGQRPCSAVAEEADECETYDWDTYCVDGDGYCDEGDGCCMWDSDNAQGACDADSQNGADDCQSYDWELYCVDGDGYCDEGDGCCGYDEDDHNGSPCQDSDSDSDACTDYEWGIYCVSADDFCDEGDGCCEYDEDNHDGGACDGDSSLQSDCEDYDWDTYCVDGDDLCDEGDGCCGYDEDDHDGGPC